MAGKTDKTEPPETVQFHYIKGKDFRVLAADGAMGSITPSGKILLTIYTERHALPRLVVQEIKPDGELGDVIETEGRSGFVREIEIAIQLDREGAENLRDWLQTRIERLDRLTEEDDK